MGDFKYQISTFNLFDYVGVERHLEKMAAKGWRFTSIGNFFWIYRKTEPAKLKYSVTYIPEASQFDPEPLEKQKDIEAYCEEAGWKKVDNWMQMQIFCSENPDAVPIETDENLRLTAIHKSMKKNFLFAHGLLLLVFLLNIFTDVSIAKNNWINFLSNGSKIWSTCVCISGILLLFFDIIYYLYWYKKAKRNIDNGKDCPEPKLYRYITRLYWIILLVCICGMLSGYSVGKAIMMALYMMLMFASITMSRNIQERMKRKGVSKYGNAVITLGSSVGFTLLIIGFLVVLVFSGFRIRGRTIEVDQIVVDGVTWNVSRDTLPMPLYADDFVNGRTIDSSRWVPVNEESFLAGYSEYHSDKFFMVNGEIEVASLRYDVITVKVGFLYDFMLDAFYDSEFRYAEEGEREKTEYRIVYESEQGTLYRQYYDGLPVAYEWLVLTADKIVPMRIYLDDITREQMEIIVGKLASK